MLQKFTKTKVSCYKVLKKNKSIMLQSFEEKQKYHVTKVWKKSNSAISNVFQEEFCTNFYEMTMKAKFATER